MRSSDSMRRGFTVAELFGVSCLMAILAAALFPVAAQQHEKAQVSACLSAMRQAGMGLSQPARAARAKAADMGDAVWKETVRPYLQSRQILGSSAPLGAPRQTAADGREDWQHLSFVTSFSGWADGNG